MHTTKKQRASIAARTHPHTYTQGIYKRFFIIIRLLLKRSLVYLHFLVEVKVKKEKVIEKGNFLWSGGGNEHEEKK